MLLYKTCTYNDQPLDGPRALCKIKWTVFALNFYTWHNIQLLISEEKKLHNNYSKFLQIEERKCPYVALGGEIRLDGHCMFDHQLGSDFTEQKEGGDAGHQTVGIHPLVLNV
jgi:hypothetical protein